MIPVVVRGHVGITVSSSEFLDNLLPFVVVKVFLCLVRMYWSLTGAIARHFTAEHP